MKKTMKALTGTFVKELILNHMGGNRNIILTYHRVADRLPTGIHDPAMYIRSVTFEMHLNEISKYYDVVPLGRMVAPLPNKRSLCAITFDDGWLDNYDEAFPILKKYGLPATIFLPVSLIGSERSFWFQSVMDLADLSKSHNKGEQFIRYYHNCAPTWNNRGIGASQISDLIANLKILAAPLLNEITLNAYGELGYELPEKRDVMNWEQVREMSNYGIAFGSHGTLHNIFTTLDDNAKRHEIAGSLRVLQDKGVNLARFLSYPNGNYDSEVVLLAKHAGYIGAVATEIGFNTSSTDPYLLKRIAIHEAISSTPSLLWFRIFQAVLQNKDKKRQFIYNANSACN